MLSLNVKVMLASNSVDLNTASALLACSSGNVVASANSRIFIYCKSVQELRSSVLLTSFTAFSTQNKNTLVGGLSFSFTDKVCARYISHFLKKEI